MTIDFLNEHQLIVLKCVSGSKAYGLDLPHSDNDFKGVFVLPQKDLYANNYVPQVADTRNDEVFV